MKAVFLSTAGKTLQKNGLKFALSFYSDSSAMSFFLPAFLLVLINLLVTAILLTLTFFYYPL